MNFDAMGTSMSSQTHLLDGIELSFDYFGAGPGGGGISALRIKSTKIGLRISVCGDTTAEQPADTVVFEIPLASDWRDVCRAIVKADYGAYAFNTNGDTSGEYAWPFRMYSKSPDSLAKDLISWTWAGPPLADIVAQLYDIPDEVIDQLLIALGPYQSREDFERLINRFSFLEKEGISLKDVLRHINQGALPSFMAMA